jgi:preprotein translocase subunit SecD
LTGILTIWTEHHIHHYIHLSETLSIIAAIIATTAAISGEFLSLRTSPLDSQHFTDDSHNNTQSQEKHAQQQLEETPSSHSPPPPPPSPSLSTSPPFVHEQTTHSSREEVQSNTNTNSYRSSFTLDNKSQNKSKEIEQNQ